MKMKALKRVFIHVTVVACLAWSAVAGASEAGSGVSADEALAKLMAGNKEFIAGNIDGLDHKSSPSVRKDLAVNGQKPYAIIVDCSDSRAVPEIIFDKGLGEVFVIRVAGNVVAPHELGSIEYALEHLGAKLVMVLGHSKCGAVTATYNYTEGSIESPNLMSLVDSIMPAVTAAKAHGGDLEEAITENAKLVAEELEKKSAVIKEFVESKGAKIVPAKYDLYTGVVSILH
jgi:carbonic anhydrase